MEIRIVTYDEVDRNEWGRLVRESETGTWFQTPEAYALFASMPGFFQPFVFAIACDPAGNQTKEALLKGICCGYITKEKSSIRQFFTRRAIILGGPCLAEDCTDEEVQLLMEAVRTELKSKAIYIECRNFNDYSKWRKAFEQCGDHPRRRPLLPFRRKDAPGFDYQPHLNIQIKISDEAEVMGRMGKHRRHRIQQSLRNGATIVEQPTKAQVEEWYALLADLYQKRIRKPLPSLRFFEALYECPNCRYTLVKDKERIIGGAVAVCLEGKAMYEWYACGRDEEKGNISPASLTKYGEMQYAIAKGLPTLDLMGAGEPGVPYGVRDFKSEFGGEQVEHGRFLCVTQPILYRIGKFGVRLLKRLK